MAYHFSAFNFCISFDGGCAWAGGESELQVSR